MPYINKDKQLSLRVTPLDDQGFYLNSPGDLNYAITHLAEQYRQYHSDSYATFNDIIGALECAKLEFSRRVVTPYEDRKCSENGDVYAPLEDT